MKQVFSVVLLGLLCSNVVAAPAESQCAVQRNDKVKVEATGAVQSGRIVNGIGAKKIERYQFAISLRYDGQFYCAASIITPTHGITSASKMFPLLGFLSNVTVIGGSTSALSGGIELPLIDVFSHPSYKASVDSLDFDVAVFTVPTNAFQGKTNMAPIALQTSELPAGTRCYVVGWGRTTFMDPSVGNELRYATMNIVSQRACIRSWADWMIISTNLMCTKYCFGVDTCWGDEGSALVCDGKLTGIAAFTNFNCDGVMPAVFSRIVDPSIRSFIRNQTGI